MRKIKFRGKDNHGEWFFGGITEDKKFIANKFTFIGVRPETVGQFTGFYDKHDKEIYEGDVVQFHNAPYLVKWLDRIGCFVVENELTFMTLVNTESYNCRIVGNIHDDPNLFQKLEAEFIHKIN